MRLRGEGRDVPPSFETGAGRRRATHSAMLLQREKGFLGEFCLSLPSVPRSWEHLAGGRKMHAGHIRRAGFNYPSPSPLPSCLLVDWSGSEIHWPDAFFKSAHMRSTSLHAALATLFSQCKSPPP